MALKLRRELEVITNERLQQKNGAASFKRVLGSPQRMTEDLRDERRLTFKVRLPIPGEAGSQGPLKITVPTRCSSVCAQVVPKSCVLPPECPVLLHKVNVIGAWLTAAKELMTCDAAIPSVLVTRPLERLHVVQSRHRRGVTR